MAELIPFVAAVAAFAGVGIVAGILLARRIDAWDTSRGEPADEDQRAEDPEA